MIERIKNSNFFIRYRNWEYWPMWLVYLPVIPVILYYAFRMRRFFFFSNVNPVFKTGALFGASKFQILSHIPEKYRPVSILNLYSEGRLVSALEEISHRGLDFPLIVKPDIGERGLLVELIRSRDELEKYLLANPIDIIIQEYIDLPRECGIFYLRKPHEKKGRIVSIGLKYFFCLRGNGRSTVRELMMANPRYRLQIERFEALHPGLLESIPENDSELNLEPIGNHSRGTTFIDGNHLINDKLLDLFNGINGEMEEVYYGRFDIKYNCWEELCRGENFRILEMNGVASEPIHVYDSTVPLLDKYKSFYSLWRSIFEISYIQKTRGYLPMRSRAAYRVVREYQSYMKSINLNWRSNI